MGLPASIATSYVFQGANHGNEAVTHAGFGGGIARREGRLRGVALLGVRELGTGRFAAHFRAGRSSPALATCPVAPRLVVPPVRLRG